jgi:hypothetical protein
LKKKNEKEKGKASHYTNGLAQSIIKSLIWPAFAFSYGRLPCNPCQQASKVFQIKGKTQSKGDFKLPCIFGSER